MTTSSNGKRGVPKAKTGHFFSIDINLLRRLTSLQCGRWTKYPLTDRGEVVCELPVLIGREQLALLHPHKIDAQGQPAISCLNLAWSVTQFSGRRAWFCCPATDCNRRAGTLYFAANGIGCRHCMDLAYVSQSESTSSRARRRWQKLSDRLGWDRAPLNPKHKPRFMHWATYYTLCDRYVAASMHDLARWCKGAP